MRTALSLLTLLLAGCGLSTKVEETSVQELGRAGVRVEHHAGGPLTLAFKDQWHPKDGRLACPALAESAHATLDGVPLHLVERGSTRNCDALGDCQCTPPRFELAVSDLPKPSQLSRLEVADDRTALSIVVPDLLAPRRACLARPGPMAFAGERLGLRIAPTVASLNAQASFTPEGAGEAAFQPFLPSVPGDGLVTIELPEDAAGAGTLRVFGEARLPVLACEGSRSCVVLVDLEGEMPLLIAAAAGEAPERPTSPTLR